MVHQPLKLSQTSARVPAVGDPEDIEEGETPESLKELMTNYKLFTQNSQVTTGSVITPLRSLLHNVCNELRQKLITKDPKLAHDFWMFLFPKVWNEIDEKQRKLTNESLPNFLACLAFVKQSRTSPNVIQSLLAGMLFFGASLISLRFQKV